LSSGLERSIFRGLDDTSFWSIPASVGYNRRVSSRASVGGRVAVQYTDYNGPESFWTVTPQLTASLLLSERLILSGALGASFAAVDDGTRTRRSTGLSASASLCKSGERTQFCGRASVDQRVATVAGPSKSVSAGLDYSRRLDADSTLQLSLDGSHYSSPISVVAGRTFSSSSYYRAAAGYTRRISDRWFGGVNLAARKLAQSGPDPQADFNGSLFIRYRFGDVR
jgi:hypothetical protein